MYTIIKDNMMKLSFLAIIIIVVMISGCAEQSNKVSSHSETVSVSEEIDNDADFEVDEDFALFEEDVSAQPVEVADPLESVNRFMHNVNDTLYFWVAKPVVDVYMGVTNKPIRIGVRNFFNNLSTPARFVNCHLQGKTADADVELGRFLINSTFGIAGIWDPAKEDHGLEAVQPEDLGQTLAVHGVDDGWYLVLPLLGPSNTRDAVGKVGDFFLNPVFYLAPSTSTAVGVSAGKYTNEGSFHEGEYEAFKEAAIDPYAAMREVYAQYRTKQIEE